LPNKAHVACFFELQPSNVGAIVGRQQKKVSKVIYVLRCLDTVLHEFSPPPSAV
jgi:hypothetical protein